MGTAEATDSKEARLNRAKEGMPEASALLKRGVEQGIFPGAVLLVGRGDEVLHVEAVGTKSTKAFREEPLDMAVDTVFDVASLTGTVATTTLLMRLIQSGTVNLDDKVCRVLQAFGVHGKSAVTIRHLLTHTAGLPSWIPFFEDILREHSGARIGILTSRGARDFIINSIVRGELKHETGSRQVYSDVGMMLLGFITEALSGQSLDKIFIREVAKPLRLKSSSFIDLALVKRRGIQPVQDMIAPTELCSWRKRILCGEVHDDNAWAMGGVAGHSGLFMSAYDLHLFAAEMTRAWHGQSGYLAPDIVQRFWECTQASKETRWLHGWDSPSRENRMLETSMSEEAVGVNGFTGCSLWIEPRKNIHVVLMSNRIHPTRNNKKIQFFRPELHDAIFKHNNI